MTFPLGYHSLHPNVSTDWSDEMSKRAAAS